MAAIYRFVSGDRASSVAVTVKSCSGPIEVKQSASKLDIYNFPVFNVYNSIKRNSVKPPPCTAADKQTGSSLTRRPLGPFFPRQRFKFWAGQIGHSAANGSRPLRHFFETSSVAREQ